MLPLARRLTLVLVLCLTVAPAARADKLVVVAGGGEGGDGAPATQARLVTPFGVDFDRAGNMYIVEMTGARVLKVDPKGILQVLGGTGTKGDRGDGGPAASAQFNGPHSLAA